MRVSGIVEDSIVDGPGLRLTVFVQGCRHNCRGCHNPQTHDPNGGYEMDVLEIIERASENPLLKGITLSGGEPFDQAESCAELASIAKARGLDVWVYSGYTYEQIMERGNPGAMNLLCQTDVLVDGPFIESEKSLGLKWRGSSNQTIIDVPASLRCGTKVLCQG